MPTSTFDLISSTTLSSGSSTITFSSIPQTYKDLVITGNTVISNSYELDVTIALNSDTNDNNYRVLVLRGQSSSANTFLQTASRRIATLGHNGVFSIDLINYSTSNIIRSFLVKSGWNGTNQQVWASAMRWNSINAITSVTISSPAAPAYFEAGSVFNLYGIAG